MTYFANGTEGMNFEAQCEDCVLFGAPCPIAYVQTAYNYDAVNNKIATEILDTLVSNKTGCMMFDLINKHNE